MRRGEPSEVVRLVEHIREGLIRGDYVRWPEPEREEDSDDE